MGYNDNDGFDFEDEPARGKNPLREQLEAALAEKKELATQVRKLQSQFATQALQSVVQKKGLKPTVAKLMAKDEVDPSDEEAIEAWLDEYGYVSTPASSGEQDGDSYDEDAAALAAMQDAQVNALPVGKYSDAALHINEAAGKGDFAAVNAALLQAAKS